MQTTLTAKTKPAHKSSKDEARETFSHHVASARELVTMLRRHLDDHMDVGPNELNWGHVGDAARLVETLKEAAHRCNLIGEEE